MRAGLRRDRTGGNAVRRHERSVQRDFAAASWCGECCAARRLAAGPGCPLPRSVKMQIGQFARIERRFYWLLVALAALAVAAGFLAAHAMEEHGHSITGM